MIDRESYGWDVPPSGFVPRSVMSKPERTASGNLVVRAGLVQAEGGYIADRHIVLSAAEAVAFANEVLAEARPQTLSEADIVHLVTAYRKAVEANQSEAAVADAEIVDAEIVDEVLEHAAHQGIHPGGDLDADSYRRLTAAVSTYRTILRRKFEREAAR